ncbi:MAG: glycosyltransferase family 25 protein [Pseudomonadota bacterium]
MKIQVINLDRRTDRWARISERLDEVGMPYERLSATTPKNLPDEARAGLKAMRDGLRISEVELACFCSHIRAIGQIASGTDPVGIVLEDDAVPAPSFKPVIEQLSNRMEASDLVRLERVNPRMRLQIPAMDISPTFSTFGLDRFDPGCGAYLVGYEAAKRIVADPFKHPMPIDIWLFDLQFPKPEGVQCRQLVPSISIQKHLLEGVALADSDSDIHHARVDRVDDFTVPGPEDDMSYLEREWARFIRRLKMMSRRYRSGNPVFYRSRKIYVPYSGDL